MDADRILEMLFPHAEILSGIFGTGGKGGLLNNLVSSIAPTAQAVTDVVPKTVQSVAPGGVPGIVNSVAPGGVPNLIHTVANVPGQVLSPIFGGGQQQAQYFVDPATGYIYDSYGNLVGQQQSPSYAYGYGYYGPQPNYYPSPYGYY
jgi:hypothetical protein